MFIAETTDGYTVFVEPTSTPGVRLRVHKGTLPDIDKEVFASLQFGLFEARDLARAIKIAVEEIEDGGGTRGFEHWT